MAERDPHIVLGIGRGAGPEEIRRAYIALAKRFHPDVNPDGEARFKAINAAYGILSAAVRSHRPAQTPHSHREPPRQERPQYERRQHERSRDEGNAFSELFGVARKKAGDQTLSVNVEFLEAIHGTKRRIWLGPRESIEITIPRGARDGQILVAPGTSARIVLHVAAHSFFRRMGLDIWVVIPVSPIEAARGTRITIPTISGKVVLTVPRLSDSGTVLRLAGMGVATDDGKWGDQFVRLRLVSGRKADLTRNSGHSDFGTPDSGPPDPGPRKIHPLDFQA